MKRPKDMTLAELMTLPEVKKTDSAIMRACWYEDDDIIQFSDETGAVWRLHRKDSSWIRIAT